MELNQHYFKVTQVVWDNMPGIKKADGPHKYNKVNQQKKYHLLTLFYKRGFSLREVILPWRRQPKLRESTISRPRPSSSSTRTTINPTSSTSTPLTPPPASSRTCQLPPTAPSKRKIPLRKNFIIRRPESRSSVPSVTSWTLRRAVANLPGPWLPATSRCSTQFI